MKKWPAYLWTLPSLALLAAFVAADPPSRAAVVAQQQTAPQAEVVIEGFRSAKFGADEKAVRAAIKTDFDADGKAVEVVNTDPQKTTSLVVGVNDLLPDTGPAQVAYIFGYKTKRLIQVNVQWGPPSNPEATRESLAKTAVLLRDYFLRQGFAAKKIRINIPFKDGTVLFFRGEDAKGHLVDLRLVPIGKPAEATATGTAQQDPGKRPAVLRLSYIEDLREPDVFQVKQGTF
jgi:hypothetical protein